MHQSLEPVCFVNLCIVHRVGRRGSIDLQGKITPYKMNECIMTLRPNHGSASQWAVRLNHPIEERHHNASHSIEF